MFYIILDYPDGGFIPIGHYGNPEMGFETRQEAITYAQDNAHNIAGRAGSVVYLGPETYKLLFTMGMSDSNRK